MLVVLRLPADSEISAADLGLPEAQHETAHVATIGGGKVVAMQDYRSPGEAVDDPRRGQGPSLNYPGCSLMTPESSIQHDVVGQGVEDRPLVPALQGLAVANPPRPLGGRHDTKRLI